MAWITLKLHFNSEKLFFLEMIWRAEGGGEHPKTIMNKK